MKDKHGKKANGQSASSKRLAKVKIHFEKRQKLRTQNLKYPNIYFTKRIGNLKSCIKIFGSFMRSEGCKQLKEIAKCQQKLRVRKMSE